MKSANHISKISFILLISLFACNQKRDSTISNDEAEIIKIDLDNKGDLPFYPISIKEKVDKLEFIPLETNDECLISEISKILFYKNTFIISDTKLGKIIQFDDKGKFLRSFGSLGRGPLEFPRIWDIEIDHKSGELGVLCSSRPLTLKYYSISNDSAYNKAYVNIGGYHFIHLDENTLLIYDSATTNENDYTLMVVDKAGNIKANYFPNPYKVGYSKSPEQSFHAYNEIITFIRENHNVVYQMTKDKHTLSERYIIDFGKYNLPKRLRDLFYTNFKEYQISSENYVSGIDKVLETDNYVYFVYTFKTNLISTFYSKQNKSMDFGNSANNWLDGILLDPITTIGNDFISICEPIKVCEIADNIEDKSSPAWLDFLKENPSYNELYNKNINENSNPILVRYNLKP